MFSSDDYFFWKLSIEIGLQGWYMDERQRAIKVALTMMFEQHPPLMRALLDTGDALLVYCSRYSSLEAELTIGMRERDLRAWLSQIDIDTRQVILQNQKYLIALYIAQIFRCERKRSTV